MRYLKLFEDFDNDNERHIYIASVISKTIKQLKYDIDVSFEVMVDRLNQNGLTRTMSADIAQEIEKFRKLDYDPTKLDNFIDEIITRVEDKYKYLNVKPSYKWINE